MIILGYKKGWRYALIFSIILLAITLIMVGINYAIYDVLIWNLFKDNVISSISTGVVQLDSLKSFYKTSAILLATGIEIPIIFAIGFLFMFLIEKKITKFMGPKVNDINKYSKDIVFRRKINFSRLTGAATLSVFTIFSASTFVSAINIISVPYKKNSWYNVANNTLAKIYTFGLTENSSTSQIVTYFISEVKNDTAIGLVTPLKFIFDGSQSGSNNFINTDDINSIVDSVPLLKELSKNRQATNTIIESLLANLGQKNKSSIDVFSLDRNILDSNLDSNKDVVGLDRSDEQIDFAALETFLNTNKITINLPTVIRDIIFSKLKTLVVDYDTTIFARELTFIKSVLKASQEENSSRVIENNALHSNLDPKLASRLVILENLSRITGVPVPSNPNVPVPVDFPVKKLDLNNPGTGDFKKSVDESEVAQTEKNQAQTLFQQSSQQLSNYEPIYENAKQNYDAILTKIANANNVIKAAENDIKSITQEINQTKGFKDKNLTGISNKERGINSLSSANIQLGKENTVLNTEITSLLSGISQLNTYLGQLNTTKHTREAEKASTQSVIDSIDSEIVSVNKSISETKAKLSNLDKDSDEYKQQKELLDQFESLLATKLANKKTQDDTMKGINDDLATIKEQIKETNSKISSKTSFMEAKNGKLIKNNATIQNNDKTIGAFNRDIANLKALIIENDAKIKLLQSDLVTKDNEIKVQNTLLVTLNADKQSEERIYLPILAQFDELTKDKNKKLDMYNQKKQTYENKVEATQLMIQSYPKIISSLLTKNNEIKGIKSQIDVFEHVNPDIVFNTPAVEWKFRDDGSIHYQTTLVSFNAQKQVQKQTIYEDKRSIFENDSKRFLDLYKEWIYGGA